jgi:hypothetical protein
VLLDLLNRDGPSANRVALLAIGSQLPLVNIGVAILAALSDVSEDRFHVTLNTGHGLMHAAQRVPGLVVIKFGHCTDRFPGVRRVTVLAREVEISVGAMRAATGNLRPGRRRMHGKSY